MKRLRVPDDWDAAADYDAIVARMRPDSRTPLSGLRGRLMGAYAAYEAASPALESLSAIGVAPAAASRLRAAIEAGSRNLACKAMVTRVYSLCDFVCPLCDIDSACTIDHYLPKEDYPEFSIFARNLTGACGTCNPKKLEGWRDGQSRRTVLHVYEDTIDSEAELLFADVEVCRKTGASKPIVTYALNCNEDAPGFAGHLARHVGKLGLLPRFESAGRRQLLAIAEDLSVRGGNLRGARKHLHRIADMRKQRHGNLHWETALYRGAAGSDAFLDYALCGASR